MFQATAEEPAKAERTLGGSLICSGENGASITKFPLSVTTGPAGESNVSDDWSGEGYIVTDLS